MNKSKQCYFKNIQQNLGEQGNTHFVQSCGGGVGRGGLNMETSGRLFLLSSYFSFLHHEVVRWT